MPAIDFVPGTEREVSSAPAAAHYAAFLRHELHRLLASPDLREAYGPEARIVRSQAARLQERDPEAWEAGGRLLASTGLDRPVVGRTAASA